MGGIIGFHLEASSDCGYIPDGEPASRKVEDNLGS